VVFPDELVYDAPVADKDPRDPRVRESELLVIGFVVARCDGDVAAATSRLRTEVSIGVSGIVSSVRSTPLRYELSASIGAASLSSVGV
jgi:hypothetical protein